MFFSWLIRFLSFYLGILFIVFPVALHAGETNSSLQEIEPAEIGDAPIQMTQKQLNDLFGEDPYLGQTSYLQSPDGFSQKDK